MSKIEITTDSGICPLNEDNMISGIINKDNSESLRDVREITSSDIIEQTRLGHKFNTSSPLLGDYYDMFEKKLENSDVIHLCMSSGISEGSVNAPLNVAKDLNEQYDNKVYVIDTLTATTGGTIINEIAKNLVNKGLTTKEVVGELEEIKRTIQTSFYVPDPEGFIRSGRDKSHLYINKALVIGARAVKMAGVKYRVDFNEDGNLYTKSLLHSKNKVGMLKLVKTIVNERTLENYRPDYVAIGNLKEKNVSMEEIEDYLKSFGYFENIINKSINGVVACYGTEDLCGISLIKRK